MGDKIVQLAGKLDRVELARIYVPPHKRMKNGQMQDVDGYWRVVRSIADLTPEERKAVGPNSKATRKSGAPTLGGKNAPGSSARDSSGRMVRKQAGAPKPEPKAKPEPEAKQGAPEKTPEGWDAAAYKRVRQSMQDEAKEGWKFSDEDEGRVLRLKKGDHTISTSGYRFSVRDEVSQLGSATSLSDAKRLIEIARDHPTATASKLEKLLKGGGGGWR